MLRDNSFTATVLSCRGPVTFTFDFCLFLYTCAQHGAGGRQRTTLQESVLLPPCGSQKWNSGPRVWQQTPLPAQLSLWPQSSADYPTLSSLRKVQKWVAGFCNMP